MFVSKYHCPDCGSTEAYRSRRRTYFERYIFPFLLLRPVRCANCFRRGPASMLVEARRRESHPIDRHAA